MIVLLRKRPCRSPGDDVVIAYWTGNYATKVAPVLNKLQVAAWGIRERRTIWTSGQRVGALDDAEQQGASTQF